MDSILDLTKEDLDKLKEKYGDLFYRVYEREVMEGLDRREMIDKLLNQEDEPRDTKRYGTLLDKYIK